MQHWQLVSLTSITSSSNIPYCCLPPHLAPCRVVGIGSGITTFVGHAHGAAESSLKGVILQRGAAIALLTALLPLTGWVQVNRLLQLLGG